jgi:predicted kinase
MNGIIMKPHLTIIRGTPGSGKSTLAAQLVELGMIAVIREADQFFHDADGNYKFDLAQLGSAHAWCQRSVAALLQAGVSVIVSNTSTTWKEIRAYLDIADSVIGGVTLITMQTQHQNVHGVPDEKVQVMRNRMFEKQHFLYTHKQVYGREFEGDYLNYEKDDLWPTVELLQSRTLWLETPYTPSKNRPTPA